jgi:hypothetical protein
MIDEEEAIGERRGTPGAEADVSREVDPIHATLSPEADPAPTLRQPYDSAEGLISEPEPESPPTAPSGGEREGASLGGSDPELFTEAWAAWPGHEVMRRDLALDEFRKLSADQQRHCRAAIPLFVAMQNQHGRKHPPNFHLWIRTRGFEEFPAAAATPDRPVSERYAVATAEGRAIKALYALAGALLFEHSGMIRYPLALNAQVMAFANLPEEASWCWTDDRQQIAAWNQFLAAHVHLPRRELVRDRLVDGVSERGALVPWPWPPRKDGSIISDQQGAA